MKRSVPFAERVWSGKPPPQMIECLVDVASWFIPEYPQFLWVGGHRVHQNIFRN